MAKSIVLYGVLLGAVVCLCGYFAGVGIGVRYEALGNRASRLRGSGYGVNAPSVILSGTQWSRKISRGVRYEALGDSFESSAVSYQPLDLRNFVGSVGGRISSVLTGSTSALSDLRSFAWPCVVENSASLKRLGSGYRVNGGEWSVMGEGVIGGKGDEVRGSGYEGFDLRSFAWPCVVENSASLKKLGSGSDEESERARHDLRQIYSAEIGVREATGKNDGQRVEEYLAATQLGKGYAWCASFISWVFAEAGFPQPRTPWSPALFPKERVVWERGRQLSATGFQLPAISPPLSVISTAAQRNGEISAFNTLTVKGSSSKALYGRLNLSSTRALKPNTQHLIPKASYLKPATADVFGIYFTNLKRIAHVGFVDEWGDKYVITVEGNTNESGSSEGDGVYKKRRLISSIYQVSDWIKGQERRIN